MEEKFKKTQYEHKNLVNYQFEVLGVKSDTRFYQRQCGKAKQLLKEYTYEDLLNILRMYKETGLPKGYKSIYFLGVDTKLKIETAKNYFASKNSNKVLESNVTNQKKVVKRKINFL